MTEGVFRKFNKKVATFFANKIFNLSINEYERQNIYFQNDKEKYATYFTTRSISEAHYAF